MKEYFIYAKKLVKEVAKYPIKSFIGRVTKVFHIFFKSMSDFIFSNTESVKVLTKVKEKIIKIEKINVRI